MSDCLHPLCLCACFNDEDSENGESDHGEWCGRLGQCRRSAYLAGSASELGRSHSDPGDRETHGLRSWTMRPLYTFASWRRATSISAPVPCRLLVARSAGLVLDHALKDGLPGGI